MRYCDHGSGYCVTTGTCDDLNACTRDSCDETSTCQHENTCQPIYVGCYTGTCDPATGCHYAPIECSDGDACNGLEYCELDVGCQPGTPPDCGGSPCYRYWCDPGAGFPGLACHSEYTCDDGNICNGVEGCDPDRGCLAGTPLDCSQYLCWDGHCDPDDGCYFTPNSGRACDDHDACTTGDHCVNGSCEGGPPLPCPDDGNVCNGREYCDWRRGCTTIPYHDCDDDDPCTDDRCDPVHGCTHGCFASFADGPELPKPDDRTFVNSDGAVLGPALNSLTIYVTRYAGPTTISGTLVHATNLTSDGLAAQDAILRIVAFGVQSGKHHAVSFSGLQLGDLKPAGCDWSVTTFKVPFNSVRFPASRGSGGGPPAQPNTVTISVDGTPACLKVKGTYLSIKVMSPVILIHGNNSKSAFFVEQGLTSGLDAAYLLSDNSIELPTDTIKENAKRLANSIPQISASFGVDSVHLVAHSKGGLDARRYLNQFKKEREEGRLTILSLTTLSTPHNGTVLADIGEAVRDAVQRDADVEFGNQPLFLDTVAEIVGTDAGTPDLQTTSAALFNAENIGGLPTDMVYSVVSAEADTNGNWRIDNTPDEYAAMRVENANLRAVYNQFLIGPSEARLVVDRYMYQVLRATRTITLNAEGYIEDTPYYFISYKSLGTPTPEQNDCLVPRWSANGLDTFWKMKTDTNGFSWNQSAANHASVASDVTGTSLRPWLKAIEGRLGDLR